MTESVLFTAYQGRAAAVAHNQLLQETLLLPECSAGGFKISTVQQQLLSVVMREAVSKRDAK